MDRYTIYCTSKQADMAIILGAPIDHKEIPTECKEEPFSFIRYHKETICPTTEQMIGWLEEQGLNINIAYNPFDEVKIIVTECSGYKEIANIKWNKSRKAAIIAAINEALEYLIEQKK